MQPATAATFSIDKENKNIKVEKAFAAGLEQVWRAWTTTAILEQWWAPKPYTVETISIHFAPGGLWHYAMVSPEGQKHFCKAYYQTITDQKGFTYKDAFCDAAGNDLAEMPSMQWNVSFHTQTADSTVVEMILHFDTVEALENILTMGFQEGFTMALGNLDEFFAAGNKA